MFSNIRSIFGDDSQETKGPKIARSVVNDAERLRNLNNVSSFAPGDIVTIIPEAAYIIRKMMSQTVPDGAPLLVIERHEPTEKIPPNHLLCACIDGEGDIVPTSIPAWALRNFDDATAQKQHEEAVAAANRTKGAKGAFASVDEALGLLRAAMPDIESAACKWSAAVAAVEALHTSLVEAKFEPEVASIED